MRKLIVKQKEREKDRAEIERLKKKTEDGALWPQSRFSGSHTEQAPHFKTSDGEKPFHERLNHQEGVPLFAQKIKPNPTAEFDAL